MKKIRLRNITKTKGSSIIELLIAVMIVGSIVTATAIGMTYTVKNSAETRYRDVASSLAQDGIEIFKREREIEGWSDFYDSLGPTGSKMCINGESPVFDPYPYTACGTAVFPLSNNNFQREATITKTSATEVKVDVTVKWNIGTARVNSITVTQEFKDRF